MVRRSEQDRLRVMGLSAAGWTQTRIVRETGFPCKFVRTWFGRTNPEDAPHPGRPPKLIPPVLRTVRAVTKGKRGRSTRKTAAVLREKKHISLSHMSVWTAARRAGLASYHKPKKPLLTEAHRERRIWFARLYMDANWRLVLLTDETTFSLFGHPNPENDVVW